MKAIKSLFKFLLSLRAWLFRRKAVEYVLNLEYHIEQAATNGDWYLYVALFILSAGLLILWNAINQSHF